MPDGVLRQRLQQKWWHQGVHHVVRDIHRTGQPVSETNPLDGQVPMEKLYLLGDRDLRATGVGRDASQQLAYLNEHVFRGDMLAWG